MKPDDLDVNGNPNHDELVDAERLRFSEELSDEFMSTVPEEFRSATREVAEECDELG